MKPTLFIAFSHKLTEAQIEGFKKQYGIDAVFVSLADRNPALQAKMSQIPATADLDYIKDLAKAIVAEAVKSDATHFFCVGEPTLTFWANLYANNAYSIWNTQPFLKKFSIEKRLKNPNVYVEKDSFNKPLICIQSCSPRVSKDVTNPDGTVTKTAVFEHVTWREMF